MKLKDRLAKQMKEYPRIAVYTYFTMSILTIIGFSIAIGAGVKPSSASGTLGVIGAGWVAAKATIPIRILATLGLTPLIGAMLKRLPRRPERDDDDDDDDDDQE